MSRDTTIRTWSDEDDEFMSMLAVYAEGLDDPARWCRELRELTAFIDAIKTVEDSDKSFEWQKRLWAEAQLASERVIAKRGNQTR